jgi:acyl-CoA thioester hydrolase
LKAAHETRIKVPFSDVDMLGHVNNAKYLTYFETARTEHMFSAFGSPAEKGFGIIIARAEIDYRSPAKWNDELVVKIRPSSLGRSSWVYEYEILKDGEKRLVAEGKTIQVSFDYSKGKPIPIPHDLRAKLQKQIDETKG